MLARGRGAPKQFGGLDGVFNLGQRGVSTLQQLFGIEI